MGVSVKEARGSDKRGFNTLCEDYKKALVELVNGSGLPIGAVYYITRTIMAEIEGTYYGSINAEVIEDMEDKNGN